MEREHRCPECKLLLAVEKNGRLFIRYKTLQFIVTGGSVLTTCRRCRTIQEIDLDEPVGKRAEAESTVAAT